MNLKKKGLNAERELVSMFWDKNWAAIRVAGSGSMKHASPDVIASNKIRVLAIECKTSKDSVKYISKKQIQELINFSMIFGAEPWIGVRFNKQEWFFIDINEMKETNKNFSVDIDLIKAKGVLFSELINE